jgi:hypothetical protein
MCSYRQLLYISRINEELTNEFCFHIEKMRRLELPISSCALGPTDVDITDTQAHTLCLPYPKSGIHAWLTVTVPTSRNVTSSKDNGQIQVHY